MLLHIFKFILETCYLIDVPKINLYNDANILMNNSMLKCKFNYLNCIYFFKRRCRWGFFFYLDRTFLYLKIYYLNSICYLKVKARPRLINEICPNGMEQSFMQVRDCFIPFEDVKQNLAFKKKLSSTVWHAN